MLAFQVTELLMECFQINTTRIYVSGVYLILPPHPCETVHDADTTRKLWGD